MTSTTHVGVRFSESEGFPEGKVAEAELTFTGGLLDGLRLVGFALWHRHGGWAVTFPATRWGAGPTRQALALLRPDPARDPAGQHTIEWLQDFLVREYLQWKREQQRAGRQGLQEARP